jgi:5-methyltetrahydrofolate--homocysteine methyltransferase
MKRQYTNRSYLDAVEDRILIFDGPMGTSLQSQKLTAEHFGGEKYNGCNDYLVITYPQAVELVHRSFLEVGVDVIETDTFRSSRITLDEYRLGEQTHAINLAAASLARRLADEYSTEDHPRFVAGSIGPSGKLPSTDDPDLSDVTFDDLVETFREQAVGLIQGGVDLLLIETSQDILEVKAAIHGIMAAFEETGIFLPIQTQVTLDTTGRMLLGTDAEAVLTILEGLPIDVIGLNCSTGPDHMRGPIEILGEKSTLPVSAIPNAGLPLNVDGEAVYPLEPEPFAAAMIEFIEKHNVSIVGGCCGTTPNHLERLVQKVKGHQPPKRPSTPVASLASGVQAVSLKQDPPPFIIGERCNAQGSRKFKRLLLSGDWDAIIEIGRKQVDYGAHALDISVAVTENLDEVGLMTTAVKKLVNTVPVPLVIDTTEPDVMEAALKTAPGRCMLNSAHLEGGREKADMVFSLAKSHNATVLVLTIDEAGMAKTAQRKLEVARKIYDIAVNDHGLRPGDLIFDALTFTLATGDQEFAESAAETIAGIQKIKAELPGVFTSLGVSNLSFGLSPQARPVLNSVFLYHCLVAGLDMAIINPAHITPYTTIPENERQLAEDLIFNRRSDALQHYIEYFEQVDPKADNVLTNPTEGMTTSERLHWRIVNRHREGVDADIDELIMSSDRLDHDQAAVQVLNTVLLPAMKEVGDKFGAGELILPFVLQSAEVMKTAVSHLETYLDASEGVTKGVVVLATVYGDVHDIGKNLVKTILSNNGFTVVDLGKQVPAETIISSAVENKADAIGLSALLVSTSKQMPLIVNELHRREIKIPVLVGGAAINRRFGRRINWTEAEEIYEPGVFYCKDAFEGLETMESLIKQETKSLLLETHRREVTRELGLSPKSPRPAKEKRSNLITYPITLPERLGPRVVKDMPLEIIFQHLSKNELFRLSWGAKNAHGDEWLKLEDEFETRLVAMQSAALREGWLQPQAVYGYWLCQSEGNDLVLYPPDLTKNHPKSLVKFSFPRQSSGDHLCLADYFSPVDSGQMDVVALQIVTVGNNATQRFDALQDSGEYTEAYYFHGLAVQTAEATADYLDRHIHRELNLPEERGKRYSWGYPAIPDLNDHSVVFDLLPAEQALGMSLTSAFQLVPEQSTAAIIVHHPEAKYFNVGNSRVDQLTK